VWLVVATLAVGIIRSVPRIAPAFPFVWRIALWATLGFLAANALLLLLLGGGFLAFGAQASAVNAGGGAARVLWGIGALAGPVIASVAGWSFGGIVGAVLALMHRQRSAAPE